nr:hypothetical protein [Tanacetum cinerariifolium]
YKSLIPYTNISDFGFSDTIMSDSEDSTVTYTTVSSPYEGRSGDISPGVDGPLAPPSLVYIPYVPEPVYPEYIPPEDDVFPAEEQPLPAAATPTTDSPGYILEFDPNEDPKDDDDEDPEEDVADYPAKHDDKEEEEPSGDDSSVTAAATPIEGRRAYYYKSLIPDTKISYFGFSDAIMSDSEDSTVTYTTVSSPYERRSEDVSPGVDGPPVMPEDPYTYVVAAFQALPPPDYVPGPEDPKQAPPSPPLPAAASPTVESPRYIPESDPDEDPEEEDDKDPKEDPTDYPADHDDDEEEEEPSGDNADEEDEEQDDDDDDEEEEHPASADSIPPPPALRVTGRISFRPQPSILSFTKDDAERFLAMHIPPPSPLTPLSSPLPQIPSPPLPASPHILPIPLPTTSPPLQLLSSDRRADRPEVTLPPQKRLSIVHYPRYEVGESLVAAAARPIEGRRADYGFVDSVKAEIRRWRAKDIGYGIRDTWIDPRDVAEEEALTTLEGVNTRVTKLAAVQEQDTHDIYGVMEDTQGRQMEIFLR